MCTFFDAGWTDGEAWSNGFCSCDFGSCLASWLCPCFLFGRVAERLRHFPDADPEHYSMCNPDCAVHCAADYLSTGTITWLPILLKRQEIRQKFDIKGDPMMDCYWSFFCPCCVLSQMNGELKKRAAAAPKTNDVQTAGYTSQEQGMVYQPAAPAPALTVAPKVGQPVA